MNGYRGIQIEVRECTTKTGRRQRVDRSKPQGIRI